jgi:adenosylcobinamide kinase/adenosylcobinamide-phosphate guanylyltransferase
MGKHLTLILGGARSGKSTYAQNLLEEDGRSVLFVATATAGDDEMAERIAAHQKSRPAHWKTVEAPLDVGKAIQNQPLSDWVLIDCITLLASNILFTLPEPVDEIAYRVKMDQEITGLLASYSQHAGEWVIVSNEVGLGLVPPYPLGRIYRDGLGRANQQLARAADTVLFLVAGIPMLVKGSL